MLLLLICLNMSMGTIARYGGRLNEVVMLSQKAASHWRLTHTPYLFIHSFSTSPLLHDY